MPTLLCCVARLNEWTLFWASHSSCNYFTLSGYNTLLIPTVHVLTLEALIKTARWGHMISYVRLRHVVSTCPCFPFRTYILWLLSWSLLTLLILFLNLPVFCSKDILYQVIQVIGNTSFLLKTLCHHAPFLGRGWLALIKLCSSTHIKQKPLLDTLKPFPNKPVPNLLP